MTKWTTANMPDQTGRTAIVTGTGGIGFETSLALARAGADVIIAGRNPAHGKAAVDRIKAASPLACVRFELLDLANLASIAAFGERMVNTLDRLDILINNAAVMAPPARRQTQDGFELQLGTNYLGHFALTAHLLPLLRQSKGSRVISLSSVAARSGAIDFDDLNALRGYKPMPVYSQSKLACLLFAFELQRRSWTSGWGISSIAAHPGVSRTDLIPNSAGSRDLSRFVRNWFPFLFQPAAQGALPILFAATAPEAKPGGYYGPDRMSETRGYPKSSRVPALAEDSSIASRLWRASEDLTSLTFDIAHLTSVSEEQQSGQAR